jgi:hypothetical protein
MTFVRKDVLDGVRFVRRAGDVFVVVVHDIELYLPFHEFLCREFLWRNRWPKCPALQAFTTKAWKKKTKNTPNNQIII